MPPLILKFGPFELDRRNFELRRDGQAVKLDHTPLELLFLLVENAGTLVTREQAVEQVWGNGVFIEVESSLYTAVRKIRRALEDDTGEPKYVQTVSRKGYRFIGDVERVYVGSPADESPAPVLTSSSRKWLWRAFAGGIFVISVSLAWFGTHRGEPHRMMLAVLPLQNFSGDPQQEYLADGLTEEIITELGNLDPTHLGVIARTSSMQYKNAKKDVPQISRELGVGYVLEGSVRHAGNEVRVTVQLIRCSDQTHLWAQSYDGELGDVLKLESGMALDVAAQTRLVLSQETHERLRTVQRIDPQAHDAYLRGLQGWNQRNTEGFRLAIAEFTRATKAAANYAPAFAGLARVYSLAPIFADIPASDAVPRALAAANQALTLDQTLADALTARAFTNVHYLYDWTSAEKEFRRAVELEPNNPYTHFFYSNSFLSPTGRHQEAIAEMKKALELDPLSTRMQCFAGRTFIWARQYDAALAQFKRVDQLDPNFALNHERMAHLYAILGRFDAAITEEGRARALVGENPQSVQIKTDMLRKALHDHGEKGYWQSELLLAQSGENPPEAYTAAFGLAMIYSHLGDRENAFAELETAYAERDEEMTNLEIEPQFDPLRSDPRFQELKQRVGIPSHTSQVSRKRLRFPSRGKGSAPAWNSAA
jgi:TolB-like protein/DNA-binding winged helix-turn-helix (wHTH) protein/tetratricopeptide (TPR) repeat protein